ncbi:MAG TPA: ATP-binding cassette domain-containing protein, partial [Gemmatimonadaceae bacterium]
MTQGLQVAGIAKRYGATVALDGVDLAVRPGEVLALLGENGAGKSTLMNVLSGEVQPDRGEMTLDGTRYAPSAPHDARGRGVALIHQELSLCPHLSVTDNVLLGNEVARHGWIDRQAARARAR